MVDGWLRVINPASVEPYPTPDEMRDLERQAEVRRRRAEEGRRAAEQAQHQAETRAQNEAVARREAGRGQREAEGLARCMVLKIVARRFGDPSTRFTARLARITDPGQLELLADAALPAASLEMFLQLLNEEDHL